MSFRIVPWLFLGVLVGCQQAGRDSSGAPWLAGAPVVSRAEDVRYAPAPGGGQDGPRRVIRIARVVVEEGDDLAPRALWTVPPAADGAEPEEARAFQRESPARVLTASFLDAREAELADVLRHPVELSPALGQEVTVTKRRDFVYPKSFHTSGAGLLRRTLSTETLGYEMRLAWLEGSDDGAGARLELSYSDSGIASYDKTAGGQWLPVFERQSLRGVFELAPGEALLFGGRRPDEDGVAGRRGGGLGRLLGRKQPRIERWILWFSGVPVVDEGGGAPAENE